MTKTGSIANLLNLLASDVGQIGNLPHQFYAKGAKQRFALHAERICNV
ncbi:MAG: hypothetical protein HZB51_15810 [Chloroflexi bacterium]|nr:hypothetical protein [Chloroflexota bacterium]